MQFNYTTTIEGATLSPPALEGDVGIDLTALQLVKQLGNNTWMYDTGICVEPPTGYYFQVFPRSSIVKTGYVLSNSVGIADAGYRGSLRVVLTKTDPSFPDLVVPFCVCQLILQPIPFSPYKTIVPVKVEELTETHRGDRGFGSTNCETMARKIKQEREEKFGSSVRVTDNLHKLLGEFAKNSPLGI